MNSGGCGHAPWPWRVSFRDRVDLAFRRGVRARGFAVLAGPALVGPGLAGPAMATLDCSFALLLERQTLFLSPAISSMVRPDAAESDISSRMS